MQELLKFKEQSLTDDELIEESSTMFFAGTDTTATSVSVGLWHLIHQPDVYARLQEELKRVMPNVDSGPSLRQLESLPLLEACIKEGLRLACPPRGRLPRVVPPEGWEVQGIVLPGGVVRRFSPTKDMQFREVIGREYGTWVMEDELPVQLKEAE
ncbi:hypothetical protein ZTR_07907 [Talaromyces verruculosus]|nr:hypothetical protein ZTR_07907 [Talaromyces verruculosus]